MKAEGFVASRLRFKEKMAVAAIAISFLVMIVAVAISAGFRREIRGSVSAVTGDVLLTNAAADLTSEICPSYTKRYSFPLWRVTVSIGLAVCGGSSRYQASPMSAGMTSDSDPVAVTLGRVISAFTLTPLTWTEAMGSLVLWFSKKREARHMAWPKGRLMTASAGEASVRAKRRSEASRASSVLWSALTLKRKVLSGSVDALYGYTAAKLDFSVCFRAQKSSFSGLKALPFQVSLTPASFTGAEMDRTAEAPSSNRKESLFQSWAVPVMVPMASGSGSGSGPGPGSGFWPAF